MLEVLRDDVLQYCLTVEEKNNRKKTPKERQRNEDVIDSAGLSVSLLLIIDDGKI